MSQQRAKFVYDSNSFKIPIFYTFFELVRYRHLIGLLVARDLNVRYKRSVIGLGWVMLSPLLLLGTLAFVFSNLFGKGQAHIATYILIGILLWTLFAQGTVAAMSSMQANSGTLKRVYVPAIVFVFSAIASALTNFAFSLVPFVIIVIADGLVPSWQWLYLLIPILQLTMLTAGVGLIIAVLGVFFADILEIYNVLLQMYFFATPVMYPVTILPDVVFKFQEINPMFYILTSFRFVVIEDRFPPIRLTFGGLAVSGLVLLLGWAFFAYSKGRFAYRL